MNEPDIGAFPDEGRESVAVTVTPSENDVDGGGARVGGGGSNEMELALAFAQRVALVPYGVLGQQMKLDKTFVQHVPEPCSVDGCCFVDPAGLHHIQPPGGPANAHGAAGAIYKSIGIDKAVSFPEDVVGAITKPGDAKYHKYTKDCPRAIASTGVSDSGGVVVDGVEQLDVHVIHTVGPDLRTEPDPVGAPGVHYTRVQAVEALALAYCNVLSEFVNSSGQHTLRLLPLSGGIFSGEFMTNIGPLTMEALTAGFDSLSQDDQAVLINSTKTVQMCIFAEKELPLFEGAGFVLQSLHDQHEINEPDIDEFPEEGRESVAVTVTLSENDVDGGGGDAAAWEMEGEFGGEGGDEWGAHSEAAVSETDLDWIENGENLSSPVVTVSPSPVIEPRYSQTPDMLADDYEVELDDDDDEEGELEEGGDADDDGEDNDVDDDDDSELEEEEVEERGQEASGGGADRTIIDDSRFGGDSTLVEELTRDSEADLVVTTVGRANGSDNLLGGTAASPETADLNTDVNIEEVDTDVDTAADSSSSFMETVLLLPFGVFGQQLTYEGLLVTQAQCPGDEPPPSSSSLADAKEGSGGGGGGGFVVVDDSCELDDHLLLRPAATTSKVSICEAIGMNQDESFPADVVAGMTEMGDAKYHKYFKQVEFSGTSAAAARDSNSVVEVEVIHVVGPDLRKDFDNQPDDGGAPGKGFTLEQALEALAEAYKNVLREFVEAFSSSSSSQKQQERPLTLLRLPPLSSGAFGGEFQYDGSFPELTFTSLQAGFERLSPHQRATLLPPQAQEQEEPLLVVRLCLQSEEDLAVFVAAGFGVDAHAFAAADANNEVAREKAEADEAGEWEGGDGDREDEEEETGYDGDDVEEEHEEEEEEAREWRGEEEGGKDEEGEENDDDDGEEEEGAARLRAQEEEEEEEEEERLEKQQRREALLNTQEEKGSGLSLSPPVLSPEVQTSTPAAVVPAAAAAAAVSSLSSMVTAAAASDSLLVETPVMSQARANTTDSAVSTAAAAEAPKVELAAAALSVEGGGVTAAKSSLLSSGNEPTLPSSSSSSAASSSYVSSSSTSSSSSKTSFLNQQRDAARRGGLLFGMESVGAFTNKDEEEPAAAAKAVVDVVVSSPDDTKNEAAVKGVNKSKMMGNLLLKAHKSGRLEKQVAAMEDQEQEDDAKDEEEPAAAAPVEAALPSPPPPPVLPPRNTTATAQFVSLRRRRRIEADVVKREKRQTTATSAEKAGHNQSSKSHILDRDAYGLGNVTPESAARLMQFARSTMATMPGGGDGGELVVLRTNCALLARNINSNNHRRINPSATNAAVVAAATGAFPSTSPPTAAAAVPPYFTKPTLVTLHLLHGSLWCSEKSSLSNKSSSSPSSPSSSSMSSSLSQPAKSSSSSSSTAFTELCELQGAHLEATLTPNGDKQRLVLTLTARAIHPAIGATSQNHESSHHGNSNSNSNTKDVKIVFFPKDKEHFIRIAGVIMYFSSSPPAFWNTAKTTRPTY